MMELCMFTPAEVETLAAHCERILAETGVAVHHDRIYAMMKDAGCECDDAQRIVKIPAKVLRELLAKVPSGVKLGGVNGFSRVMEYGARPVINGIVIDPWIMDYPTGRPRRPALADIERNTRLQQALGADSIYRMIMDVTDCRDATSQWRGLEVMLKNNDRAHVTAPTSLLELETVLEAIQVQNGGRDISGAGLLTVAVPMLSPLTVTGLNGDLLIRTIEAGCTPQATVCPMCGSTGPYSNMGIFLMGQAESLAFCAIAQLIKPGAPVLGMNSPSVTDMRSGHDLYYTPDKYMWKVGSIELHRHFGLMCGSEMAGTTPPRFDMQSGAEAGWSMMAAIMCGSPYLSGLGSCYNANGVSSEMIVLQHAMLQAMLFARPGLRMDDAEAGLESIARVGPGGNFLTDDTTVERLRTGEFFSNPIFDYSGDENGKSMLERAHERVLEIEAEFVSPVKEQVCEELTRYFEKLYARL